MWNKADVVHIKVQSRTYEMAKDHETSVKIASDCVEI